MIIPVWLTLIVSSLILLTPPILSWSPDCRRTDFVLLGRRPVRGQDKVLLETTATTVFRSHGIAVHHLTFNYVPDRSIDSCDELSDFVVHNGTEILNERSYTNCSFIYLFDCMENTPVISALAEVSEILFLDTSQEIFQQRHFSQVALSQFLSYYAFNSSICVIVICAETGGDSSLDICQGPEPSLSSSSFIETRIFLPKNGSCVEILRTIISETLINTFIFALPVRQLQQCLAAALQDEIFQTCDMLLLMPVDSIAMPEFMTVLDPVLSSILAAAIYVQQDEASALTDMDSLDNSTRLTGSIPNPGRDIRHFLLNWRLLLHEKASAQTVDRIFNITFSLHLQGDSPQILATFSSVSGETFSPLVDFRSYGNLACQRDTLTNLNQNYQSDATYSNLICCMAIFLALIVLTATYICWRISHQQPRIQSKTEDGVRLEQTTDVDELSKLVISPDEVIPMFNYMDGSRSFGYSMSLTGSCTKPLGLSHEICLYQFIKVWVKRRELSYHFVPESHHLSYLKKVKAISHPNLAHLRGIILSSDPLVYDIKFVWEFCARGSLYDLISNETFDVTPTLQIILIKDIVKAMSFIHQTAITCHGSLKSPNCLITDRFNIKITDYGLNAFPVHPPAVTSDESLYHFLVWTAPEILRGPIIRCRKGTKAGDVYSFSVIVNEILTQSGPYCNPDKPNLSPKEIVTRLIEKRTPPFRPCAPASRDTWQPLLALMSASWAELPESRPTFKELQNRLDKLPGFSKNPSYLNYVINKLSEHAEMLEQRVRESTRILLDEQRMSDDLLAQMMPRSVLERLKRGQTVDPETFEQVTLSFTAVTDFARFVFVATPFSVIQFLNGLYYMFDEIIEQFDVYKVETVQESYILVSGLPIRNGTEHAPEVARMGLKMFEAARNYYGMQGDVTMSLKLGAHTGTCVAGVIGHRTPRYCLFGDTINTASRMSSVANANEFVVSESTQCLLDSRYPGLFRLISRGDTEVKGKGVMKTFDLYDSNIPL